VITFWCDHCEKLLSEKKVKNDMKKEFEKLKERYPQIYKKPVSIDVDIGWVDILDKLSRNLEKQIDQYKSFDSHRKMPCISTIEERYGSLRIYLEGNGTEKMYTAIENAEDESGHTCQRCGEEGELRGAGWLVCLCNECEESRRLLAERVAERIEKRQQQREQLKKNSK